MESGIGSLESAAELQTSNSKHQTSNTHPSAQCRADAGDVGREDGGRGAGGRAAVDGEGVEEDGRGVEELGEEVVAPGVRVLAVEEEPPHLGRREAEPL